MITKSILSLSDLLLIEVFENLNVIELGVLQRVCKRFYEVSKDNRVWKHLYLWNFTVVEEIAKYNVPESKIIGTLSSSFLDALKYLRKTMERDVHANRVAQ